MPDLKNLLHKCAEAVHEPEIAADAVFVSVCDPETALFTTVPNDFGSTAQNVDDEHRRDVELHKLLLKKLPHCRVLAICRSENCRRWADGGQALPPLSLLHARYFLGEVRNIGGTENAESSAETLADGIAGLFRRKKAEHVPAALVPSIGAVTWHDDVEKALEQLLALDELCHFAVRLDRHLNSCFSYLPPEILYEEYYRRHNLGPQPIQRGPGPEAKL